MHSKAVGSEQSISMLASKAQNVLALFSGTSEKCKRSQILLSLDHRLLGIGVEYKVRSVRGYRGAYLKLNFAHEVLA